MHSAIKALESNKWRPRWLLGRYLPTLIWRLGFYLSQLHICNCLLYPWKVSALRFTKTKVMVVLVTRVEDNVLGYKLRGGNASFAEIGRGKWWWRMCTHTFSDVSIRWLPKITCGEEEAGSVTIIALSAARCDRWLLLRWQGLINCGAVFISQSRVCCIAILLGICKGEGEGEGEEKNVQQT